MKVTDDDNASSLGTAGLSAGSRCAARRVARAYYGGAGKEQFDA